MTTGVPYFPQSLAAGTIVGRLSTNPGPTEAIPIATLASALGIGAASLIITGVAGTNTITGVTTGAPALAANQTAWFIPAATNTGATTLNRDGLGAKNLYYNGGACVGGELIIGVPAIVFYDGTKYNLQSVPNTYSTTVSTPRSYLAGLTLSTAGGSGTMSIAAGFAVDSTNVAGMSLAAFTKTTSSWALGTGNGGLDTGTIANSTWYHWYLIQRVDTKVVDVIFSTSASAPTYPANYTICRRIGSGLTDGSAHWTAFIQDGDFFEWAVPVLDYNSTNPGATAVTLALSTPLGVKVMAWIGGYLNNQTTANPIILFSDLAVTDSTPSTTIFSMQGQSNAASAVASADFNIRTNTSSQIRSRLSASGAADTVKILTKGWYDRRGRDT